MPSRPQLDGTSKKRIERNLLNTLSKKLIHSPLLLIQILTNPYEAFCSVILLSAKVYVPRGRRKIYTPCWDQQCQVHLEQLQDAPEVSQQIIAEKLIHIQDELRRNRWEEAANNIDFTHTPAQSLVQF